VKTTHIDAWLDTKDFNAESILDLKRLEPFGCGHVQPILGIQSAKLAGAPRIVGNNHLKFTVKTREDCRLDIIGWSQGRRTSDLQMGQCLSLAGSLHLNAWNGSAQLQFELLDFKPE
jgi:single-stranded-DNA-specific exonuclease